MSEKPFCKMRSVVFVEKIELDFSGNIFANALVLGDVDNDSLHELMVGSVDGELWIYKGDNTVPLATASNLGMIVCTEIADVCNASKNVAVVLCADGLCYLFAIDKQSNDIQQERKQTQIQLLFPSLETFKECTMLSRNRSRKIDCPQSV
nr:KICSTOR complex protein ITFG2-like [Lytechinus pictus]